MTSKEIEELAGHRPVSAWVIKLVNDAIAIERENCAKVCDGSANEALNLWPFRMGANHCAAAIRARGQE